MTKNEFLNALHRALLYLPARDRQEILQDYEEHFAAGLEQGKTEEEICRALGDPQEIAQTYLQQSRVEARDFPQLPAPPEPPTPENRAAAQPQARGSNGRLLYIVLFVLDLLFIARPGIPAGVAVAGAGAAILAAGIGAGLFASSVLLALFLACLSLAFISAGVLAVLLILWSLRACYRKMC